VRAETDLYPMGGLSRAIGVLVGVVLLAFAGTAWADDDDQPRVSGTAVSAVTSTSAVLNAVVDAQNHNTTYRFEYGPTSAYGFQTAQGFLAKEQVQPVSAQVVGLLPSTTYHYRVVATNKEGTTRGPDRSFTTLASAPGSTEPGPDPAAPGTPTDGGPAAPTPDLGKSVLVTPAHGELRVRRPGTTSFVTLELGSELPVGTEVDARDGALALTSALPSGATQTGQFGGGRFVVRQGRRGYIDLFLKGRRRCFSATTARPAVASKPPRLWGRDKGGRFRTHGKNSHATVRGTRWSIAETCTGTLTRVNSGSVVVRDTVLDKRVVLRAGERYLARPPHGPAVARSAP
jgi:hypothetical protein